MSLLGARGIPPGARRCRAAFSGVGGGRDGGMLPHGPTSLDTDARAALLSVLRPCHFPIVVPWLRSAPDSVKRDLLRMADMLAAARKIVPSPACAASMVANGGGRDRHVEANPPTADRLQSDLLRTRSTRPPREYGQLEVNDYQRFKGVSLRNDPTTKVLTEEAKALLARCQATVLDKDNQAAAQVMRALRHVNEAVTALPTYQDFRRSSSSAGVHEQMFEYAQQVPRGPKRFREGMVPGQLRMSRSAPVLIRQPGPFITPEEIASIPKPGGDVVNYFDQVPLQTMKNREKAIRSKVAMAGGKVDWTTTSGSMAPVRCLT